MLAEATDRAIVGETPIVQPRNLVQSTLQILMVFPAAIENTVEEVEIQNICLLPLGPYSVIISFSSTARILLKLPHGKPLFTLCLLRRTREAKLL